MFCDVQQLSEELLVGHNTTTKEVLWLLNSSCYRTVVPNLGVNYPLGIILQFFGG